jgi:hypothetical protein
MITTDEDQGLHREHAKRVKQSTAVAWIASLRSQ